VIWALTPTPRAEEHDVERAEAVPDLPSDPVGVGQ
jgi:hypothetical protein